MNGSLRMTACSTEHACIILLGFLYGDLAWAVTVNINSRCAGVQRLCQRA